MNLINFFTQFYEGRAQISTHKQQLIHIARSKPLSLTHFMYIAINPLSAYKHSKARTRTHTAT